VPIVIYELNESAVNFIQQDSFEKALILLQKGIIEFYSIKIYSSNYVGVNLSRPEPKRPICFFVNTTQYGNVLPKVSYIFFNHIYSDLESLKNVLFAWKVV
jgi:hypothetical protein